MPDAISLPPVPAPLAGLSPIASRELAMALAVSDELDPSPARARTALLILRSALAHAVDVPVAELARIYRSNETPLRS